MLDSFGHELKRLREAAGLSQNALAKSAGLNASYINRLESGEREPPRPETVILLAEGLGASREERDRLLVAAGHLPTAMARLGPGDPTLGLVADILADESLPARDREEFRQVISAIGKRWRHQPAK